MVYGVGREFISDAFGCSCFDPSLILFLHSGGGGVEEFGVLHLHTIFSLLGVFGVGFWPA